MRDANSIDRLAARLELADVPQSWRDNWEQSLNVSPDHLLENFTPQLLDELTPLADGATDALVEAAKTIASDGDLLALLGLWHYLLFHAVQVPGIETYQWPVPTSRMGDQGMLFSSVALLSGAGHVYEMHAELGVPPEITSHTLSDIDIWLRDYHDKHGIWGMDQTGWMTLHFTGKIFWLGRLQFRPETFTTKLRAFRNRKTGQVAALLEDGVKVRQDGLIDGTNDIFDPDAWTSELSFLDNGISGYPVSHLGFVLSEKVTLSEAEWEQALAPGDPIVEIHIPASGKMDYGECGEAFHKAVEFFRKHMPDYDFKAFTCISWLLEPQLEKLLSPDSNIIKFLSEYYLFPFASNDSEFFRRVFGEKPADLTKAPRDSGLRRAILDFTLAGNHLHMAGGFILKEDLNWGSTPYRSRLAKF